MKQKRIAVLCLGLLIAGSMTACGEAKTEAETSQGMETEETKPESSSNTDEQGNVVYIPFDEDESSVQVFNPPAGDEDPDMTANEKAEKEGLPSYKSAVSGSIEEAITLYLWKEFGFEEPNEEGAVNIPAYVIIKQSEVDDVTSVYGDFWVYGYKLEDKNLLCINGGSYPGVFKLRQNENGYEAFEFEMLEDGSGYQESLEKACEGDEELEKKFLEISDSSAEECMDARRNFINLYAVANHLEIESYQDEGWDPVFLNE